MPKNKCKLRTWVVGILALATLADVYSLPSNRSQQGAVVPAGERGIELTVGQKTSEPLLVTLLDGKIAAIDKENGSTVWVFDTNTALISARGSKGYAFTVVPGVQGELYTQAKGSQAGFQMLPETLPQWVEKTPFVMSDGSLWLGSRHTHAFFVDSKTGKLIKDVEEYGEEGFRDGHELTDHAEFKEGSRPILLGRVDYRVRAVHQDTGMELFNVSYSHLSLLDSSLKLPSFGDTHVLDEAEEAEQLGIFLDPEGKNSIHRINPKTNEEMWSKSFEQPPVTVFAGSERGKCLYGAPAWPAADGIGSRLGVVKKDQPSIMIESMEGNYYALPLVNKVQQSGLLPLLPPGSTEKIKEEAEVCKHGPSDVLPEQTVWEGDAVNEEASAINDVMGVHYLDNSPSLFISGRVPGTSKPPEANEGGSFIARMLGNVGMFGMASISGATVVAVFVFFRINEKPRVIASLKDREEGIRTLTLSFTGTTEEVDAARKQSESIKRMTHGDGESTIRDWTGSGEEHHPQMGSEKGEDCDAHGAEETGKPSDPKEEGTSETASESPFSMAQQQEVTGNEIEGKDGKMRRKKRRRGRKEGDGANTSASDVEGKEQGQDEISKLAGDSGRESDSSSSHDSFPEEAPESDRNAVEDFNAVEEGEEDAQVSTSKLNQEGDCIQDYNAVGCHDLDPNDSSTSQQPSVFEDGPTSWRHLQRSQQRDGITYVGRLAIGPGIVGYGSSGTLVFEGSLDGRQVAVKRVLRQFYDLARKEIAALIVADEHPNIVRCFAMEEDTEFVYLALERCKQSLNDVLGLGKISDGWEFVSEDGLPTDFCLRVCMEVGKGLLALHERSIVHRDLKPHNVLFTEGMKTKLSDMGLCKRLTTDQTSYDSAGPGGSTGWQAPEQLLLRSGGEARLGRSVDIFTFGLLLFYCLTGGQHPFGEGIERDYRILNGRANLDPLRKLPDALNMIRAMLRPQSKQRPTVAAVLAHPFWWSPAQKVAFLVELSNRLENEDREVDRSLLHSLEGCAEEAIGGSSWANKLDEEFLANLGKYRKYNFSSLRDLLRVIRNKHNHFREMPEELQRRVGRTPEAFFGFFSVRFPALLLTAYAFALSHCREEPLLQSYFPEDGEEFPFASASTAARLHSSRFQPQFQPVMLQDTKDRTSSAPPTMNREPALVTVDELRETTQRAKSDTNLLPPPPPLPRTGRSPAKASSGPYRDWWAHSEAMSTPSGLSQSAEDMKSRLDGKAAKHSGSAAAKHVHAWPALRDMGKQEVTSASHPDWPALVESLRSSPREVAVNGHSLLSSEDSYGATADGILIVNDALQFALTVTSEIVDVKGFRDNEGQVNVFPQRPKDGQLCDFFVKTGSCKFGEACHFHHPLSYSVKISAISGHPMRPGQPICPFYDRTGACKFGPACKFNHPPSSARVSSDSSSQSQCTTSEQL